MKKKLLLLSSSLVTLLGGLLLLSSPVRAGEPDLTTSGCVKKEGCRLVSKECWSGWSSTGDPVTWCECGYSCS